MVIVDQIKDALQDLSAPDLKAKADSLLNEVEELAKSVGYQAPSYIEKLKAYNKAQEIYTLVLELSKQSKELIELEKLISNNELTELATEDLKVTEISAREFLTKLRELTKEPLENDNKQAIMEIRPGVGGIEASLFAEELFRMYTRYCTLKNFSFEVYNLEYNPEGGINEAIFLVQNEGSFGVFRFESGVHRVQRVPSTEASGRIHTSTASVAVLPKLESTDVRIKPEDLRIDVYRSSGPGGQSVNTTDSAVRITHIPSGLTVSCQNSKSQHKNKETAMAILAAKLYDIERSKTNENVMTLREEAIQGGDRSVKIRTYNFPQGRITDHRISKSWFTIDLTMNGELDEIITTTNDKLRDAQRTSSSALAN